MSYERILRIITDSPTLDSLPTPQNSPIDWQLEDEKTPEYKKVDSKADAFSDDSDQEKSDVEDITGNSPKKS